ncbi:MULTISPECIES: glycosyltransferase [Pseudoclavibacter]|uniref:glycosyltransferase n=1 Tax=Pseudoclavibacter TaxID=255204 RepID=UPI0015CA4C43|nr:MULTISPECIES: glycosyltransferase [Pseudoclavibacter]NYF12757.1 glycosyltransferase involved in cell wall biosynthesis [Pseudoclavibacter sp. JAI123]
MASDSSAPAGVAATLAIVMPGHHPWDGGARIRISDKTLSGMIAYQERWHGSVVMVTRGKRETSDSNLGLNWVDIGDLPFAVEVVGQFAESSALRAANVVMAPHTKEYEWLLELENKTVFYTENLSSDWAASELRDATGVLPRLRLRLGWMRHERIRQRMARRADGLQCNGRAVWAAYGRSTRNAMVYYDTRLDLAHVEESKPIRSAELRGDLPPLRIAFSGRFLPIKGTGYVIDVHDRLRELGVAHRVSLIGAGPLEDELRARADADVEFLEPMEFASQWTSHIREHVDVMLLPHVLGDPSGTYLEAAGLGVPIVGFDNAALSALVDEFGLGWTARMGDVDGLASILSRLAEDREELEATAAAGRAAMLEHHAAAEFDRRVAHLEALVR